MKCGYEVPEIILLHAYLYTYSLLKGFTFKVLPLSSYALSQMMPPLLQTFLELLLWNSLQCHHHILLDVFNILKSLSLKTLLIFGKSQKLFRDKWGEKGRYSISVIDVWSRNFLTESTS
jgi:hypothetical protein